MLNKVNSTKKFVKFTHIYLKNLVKSTKIISFLYENNIFIDYFESFVEKQLLTTSL